MFYETLKTHMFGNRRDSDWSPSPVRMSEHNHLCQMNQIQFEFEHINKLCTLDVINNVSIVETMSDVIVALWIYYCCFRLLLLMPQIRIQIII